MKIYKQMNNNDCGICITQSLINHFYKKEVKREQIIDESKISSEGLTILDLENLNNKFGIKLESYEVNYEDFVKYQTKNYFILMLKYEYGNHYVIAKKNKNGIIIYDSINGKKELSYEILKNYFMNIYIEFFKFKKTFQSNFAKENKKIFINYKIIFQIIIIEVFLIGLNILTSYFIKSIFQNVINSSDISNLGIIIFISVIAYLSVAFGNFLVGIVENKQRIFYYKELSSKFIDSLLEKNNNFFSKISSNQFVMINEHIENISKYYSFYFNSLWINSINITFLLIFIFYINWQILIIILISILIQLIYTYVSYKFNKKNFPKYKYLKDQNKRIYFQIENFINNEINIKKFQNILFYLKNNISNQAIVNKKIEVSHNFIEKFNNFFNYLINLCLYSLGAYLFIMKNIEFGSLILIVNFFSYITNSTNKLINFSFFKLDFNFSINTYLGFLNIANQKSSNFKWETPKEIDFKNISFYYKKEKVFENFNLLIRPGTFIYGPSGSGKSTIYNLICNRIQADKGKIMINKINIDAFDQQHFTNNIIYQKNISYVPEKYSWNEILKNLPENIRLSIVEIAHEMNLELYDNQSQEKMSSGQSQFVSLAFLLTEKNKLIIIDEITSQIDSKIREKIYEKLISYLSKNNFLICSEHDLNMSKFFSNKINLSLLKNE